VDDAYQVAAEIAAQAQWSADVRTESFGISQARITHASAGWWIGLTIPRPGGSGSAHLVVGRMTGTQPSVPLVRSGPVPVEFGALVLVAKSLVRHLETGATPGAQLDVAAGGGGRVEVLPDLKQLFAAVGVARVAAVVVDRGAEAAPLVRLRVVPDREPEDLDIPWDAGVLTTVVAGADTTADCHRQLADVVALGPVEDGDRDGWIRDARARFPSSCALVRTTPGGCEVLLAAAKRRPDARNDLGRDHLLVALDGDTTPQWAAAALCAWTDWDRARKRRAGESGPLDLALPASGALEFIAPGGAHSQVAVLRTRVVTR